MKPADQWKALARDLSEEARGLVQLAERAETYINLSDSDILWKRKYQRRSFGELLADLKETRRRVRDILIKVDMA